MISLLDLPVEIIFLIAGSLDPLAMKDFYHLISTHRCLFNILLPRFNHLAATEHTINSLCWASAIGNEPMIRLLEEKGAVSIRGHTRGKEQSDMIVKIALSRRANLSVATRRLPDVMSSADLSTESSIKHAVMGRAHHLTLLLLERGANVKEKDSNGQYILHAVASHGAEEAAVARMIELGADVNATDLAGRTPLHCIVFHRPWTRAVTEVLLAHGADTMIKDRTGNNVVQARLRRHGGNLLPVSGTNEMDIKPRGEIRLLLKYGSISFRDRMGRSGLHLAAASNDVDLAETLVSRGIDLDARDRYGATALHLAVEFGSAKAVQALIEAGINSALGDNYGDTPLHLATRLNCPAMVRLLLWKGVDTSIPDNFHSTALHLAAEWEDAVVVRLLLKAGANANARDKDDRTPLLLAARYGHLAVVKALSDNGADILARDNRGRGAPRWILKEA